MRNSHRIIKYPVKMNPVYKDYVWGGTRLNQYWGKKSPYQITAESWELASHQNGESRAANGPLEGMTLGEVVRAFGPSCIGDAFRMDDRFPILIKWIDSQMKLSIQVHPDDAYAMEYAKDRGKTETWYVAQADADAFIYCGLKENLTKEAFHRAVCTGTVTDHLNRIPVRKGQVFHIRPGTIHAICEGMVIAEIQQNSDVTYRIYDYDRKGPDGASRPLHIDHALRVVNLTAETFNATPMEPEETRNGMRVRKLTQCPYFRVVEYIVEETVTLIPAKRSFQAVLFIDGTGNVCCEHICTTFSKGDCYFLPAGMSQYTIEGACTFLLTEL